MNSSNIDPLSESDFLEVLSELISIPSVKGESTENAPYGVATAQALDYLLGRAEASGLSVRTLDNRVGYAEWGSGSRLVAVLCHLDVVPPGEGWETEPFSLTRKEGLLIGRGVMDNKGPAVCALFALLRLKESGYIPSCRIRLIFGLDEEHDCTCMDHYVAVEELPDTGFTPDASFPAIFAEKGILQFSVRGQGSTTVEAVGGDAYNMVPSSCSITDLATGERFPASGIPAHASTPEKGVNAILKAVSALPDTISRHEPLTDFLGQYLARDKDISALITSAPADISGDLTVNVGLIRISSDESMAGIDIRYPVESSGDDIYREISGKAASFGLETRIVSHLKPLFTPPDSHSMIALRGAYNRYVQQAYLAEHPGTKDIPEECLSSDPIAIGGGTYARSMPDIVAFGPVFPWEESKMHQKNESCSERVMLISVSLYEDAVKSLCESLEA